MPNPSGANGSSNGDRPPDDELRVALLEYAKKCLPLERRLVHLSKQFNYHIKKTKLKQLNNEFNIPSACKCKIPFDQINQLVIEKVSHDVKGMNGPESICTKIALDGVIITREVVRQIMHANWDERFDCRYPGAQSKPQRGHLTSLGPWHEISADGHEKIGAAALDMGGVELPCYAFCDKWYRAPLRLVVIPNDCLSVVIGHVYLDLVEDYQMVPFQLTVEKGSETSIMGSFHLALWQQFAPELSPDKFTAFMALPSVRNIMIEGCWCWLRQDCGINLHKIITEGHKNGIYNIASKLHAYVLTFRQHQCI
ncbi:hypothetical protein K439DRAFT_1622354 [Ramaria rubella]|nr:hypothetical protein K439DRAFT_1622354 [Ramaria rubella]